MANKIILKKTSTASKVPLSSDLEIGEIAVNLADQKLYSKNASGTVILVGSGGGGSGDVIGPSSATDNALARFDSTTGKLIQNGVITQDDNGSLANVNAISLDTTPTSLPTTAGSMYWDEGNKTPTVIIDTDVALQLGQEMLALVYNGTGSTITNGSVVAVSGAQGQRPSVVLADADSEALSAPTLGIATEDIANGAEGFVTTFGFVRGLDTSAFTAGAPIYLSQTAGQFTATRPSAPAHTVALGWVIKVNASSGEVFVNINNGWELDELHNVLITSPISGNTLIYDAVAGVWKNANITAGTGISVTNGAGSITIANTGVTNVTGTAPISSSGGATPAISISQASSTTNGYLSSTDWNTFNNKTSNTGTVTSVSMTVPTGLSISGSPITTSGTLALTLTAGYSIPTTSSQTNWDTAYTDRLKWDGGATGLTASTGRTSLGATTLGSNLFTITNPSAVTFPRFNADNTVSALDAATFRSAIGAGTGSGTVTSVSGTGTVSGLSLSGTVTSSGNLTLGGTLSADASAITSGTIATARLGSGTANSTTYLRGDQTWATISAGISWNTTVQTTGFTASANTGYFVNTTSGAITVTLPASPTAGTIIGIVDYAGTVATNAITINPNGLKINGSTTNASISVNRIAVQIVYVDATQGWVIVAAGNEVQPNLLQPYTAEYLIIAGGGGGGTGLGGGGGAGGYISTSATLTPATSYSVTVGAGGAGASTNAVRASSGSNSVFNGSTAIGGGGGTGQSTSGSGLSGGSGGGGARNNNTGGTGTAGQGNDGGAGSNAGGQYGGGGGGGKGAAGGAGSGSGGGNGGNGSAWSDGVTRAGGGGGAANTSSPGAAGSGGATAGTIDNGSIASNATVNTGSGAGGGASGPNKTGGDGGSGIVIIRYAGGQKGTGGTVTSSGGYTYHTFTSSGTYIA